MSVGGRRREIEHKGWSEGRNEGNIDGRRFPAAEEKPGGGKFSTLSDKKIKTEASFLSGQERLIRDSN